MLKLYTWKPHQRTAPAHGSSLSPTVGRDPAAGLPSGKVHIEYTDILAARKALRLARSLLLDRPVHVRAKALRRF